MKAILEFNLDDHYDNMSHKCCMKASDMAIVLFHVRHNMSRTEGSRKDLYDEIMDLMDDFNINLDEITE